MPSGFTYYLVIFMNNTPFVAEEPRDAFLSEEICQPLHECTTNSIWKGLYEVNELKITQGQGRRKWRDHLRYHITSSREKLAYLSCMKENKKTLH